MARTPRSSKGSKNKPEETTEDAAQAVANDSDAKGSGDSPVAIEGEAIEAEPSEADAETAATSSGAESVPAEEPGVNPDPAVPGAVHAVSEHSEPASAPTPTPEPRPASSGASFLGMAFGGLIAGAIGFAVAAYGVPRGWFGVTAAPGVDTSAFADAGTLRELAAEVEALRKAPAAAEAGITERLEAISADIETLRGASSAGVTPVDLVPIENVLAELDGKLTGLERRVAALEAGPEGPDGSAAMEAQLEAFRSELDTLAAEAKAEVEAARSRAAEIETQAAEAARAAERDAALSEIRAALNNGSAFNDVLEKVGDVPEPLAAVATEGVVTLSTLQREFPDAARNALAVTQSVPENATVSQRLTAFVRRQTNARSLAPREGDDVDAILSRAEAALTGGDLDVALVEIDKLPEAARAAMSGWLEKARARAAARQAVAGLSGGTN